MPHPWNQLSVNSRHIAICYMAFCCLRHLRKRLNMPGHPMSPARIQGIEFKDGIKQTQYAA